MVSSLKRSLQNPHTYMCLCDYVSKGAHSHTVHSFSPCPSTTSNWDKNKYQQMCRCGCWINMKNRQKIRHHMLFLAKLYEVKVCHSDDSNAGWGSYTGTLLNWGDATFEKVMKKWWRLSFSVPAVVLYHVGQLDDELPLFVFLAQLECLLIFPAQCGVTVFTVDVGNSVKPCE